MKWSYKTVHFELKKEGLLSAGFLDEMEIEQELNEFGRNGWELISVLEVQDGIIAFFKQPFGLKTPLPKWPEHTEAEAENDDRQQTYQVSQRAMEKSLDLGDEPSDSEYPENSGIGTIKIE